MTFYKTIFILTLVITVFSCKTSNNNSSSKKGKGLNLFTLSDDIKLGAEVAAEIENDSDQFNILDSASNSEVYKYLYKVRDTILNSGEITYRDEFKWRIRIIEDDSTLNAFCTPGGYIYIYTGILKFLDSEDQFAGVLAHEIAHADMRHSTRQMSKSFGVQVILDLLAGNQESIKKITQSLIMLKFSRKYETEADEKSVHYLCPTTYNANAGAEFFIKINSKGGTRTPEFLSTHPDPGNRIENYQNNAIVNGCIGKSNYVTEYKQMLKKLP